MKAAFERAHKARFGFIDRTKALVVEAVSVEAVGGGAPFQGAGAQDDAPKASGAGAAHALLFRRQMAPRLRLHPREARARHKVAGPAVIIEPHQTVVVEDGWQAELTAKNHLVLRRIKKLVRARADRHPRRSGDAGSVQQPVHVDRRADGRSAAEHRLFGQHQGAARFLLRGVRRRRLAGRQRAAYAGASRLDGSRGRDHHPREQGQHPPRRCLRDQRAL